MTPAIDESCACNQFPFMRLNTLEKLYLCLRDLQPEVTLPEQTRLAARALTRSTQRAGVAPARMSRENEPSLFAVLHPAATQCRGQPRARVAG